MNYEQRCEDYGNHLIVCSEAEPQTGAKWRCVRCGAVFFSKEVHETEVATAEEAGREQSLEVGIALKEAEREAYD